MAEEFKPTTNINGDNIAVNFKDFSIVKDYIDKKDTEVKTSVIDEAKTAAADKVNEQMDAAKQDIVTEANTYTDEKIKDVNTSLSSDGSEIVTVTAIRGKTVKYNNLVDVHEFADNSSAITGLSFVSNKDGSIKVTGSFSMGDTKSVFFKGSIGSTDELFRLPAGTYYIDDCILWNGASEVSKIGVNTFAYDQVVTGVGCCTLNMNEEINRTLKPRVYPGDIDLKWMPYFEGLKNAVFEKIESKNADGTKTDSITAESPIELAEWDVAYPAENRVERGSKKYYEIAAGDCSFIRTSDESERCLKIEFNSNYIDITDPIKHVVCDKYRTLTLSEVLNKNVGIAIESTNSIVIYDPIFKDFTPGLDEFEDFLNNTLIVDGKYINVIYKLATTIGEDYFGINKSSYRSWKDGSVNISKADSVWDAEVDIDESPNKTAYVDIAVNRSDVAMSAFKDSEGNDISRTYTRRKLLWSSDIDGGTPIIEEGDFDKIIPILNDGESLCHKYLELELASNSYAGTANTRAVKVCCVKFDDYEEYINTSTGTSVINGSDVELLSDVGFIYNTTLNVTIVNYIIAYSTKVNVWKRNALRFDTSCLKVKIAGDGAGEYTNPSDTIVGYSWKLLRVYEVEN